MMIIIIIIIMIIIIQLKDALRLKSVLLAYFTMFYT